jgi:putative transposase
MTYYRRNFIAGGCFFFTVNLVERRLLTEHIEALRAALRRTQQHHPFTIDAMVAAGSSARHLDAAGRRR